MARIAFEEIGIVLRRYRQSCRLPSLESTGHRSKTRVALRIQSLGSSQRPLAAAADQQNLDVPVRNRLRWVTLQHGVRSKECIRGRSKRVFIGLADIDQHGALLLPLASLLRSDF